MDYLIPPVTGDGFLIDNAQASLLVLSRADHAVVQVGNFQMSGSCP